MYCGIDPGMTGGIVIVDSLCKIRAMWVMPVAQGCIDLPKLKTIIHELRTRSVWMIAIERVHAIFGSSAKGTFNFGYVAGLIEGLVSTSLLPYRFIQPKEWQKIAHAGVEVIKKQGKASKDAKAMSLIAARRLFPEESFLATDRCKKPHLGLVDAALIAYAGMVMFVGKE